VTCTTASDVFWNAAYTSDFDEGSQKTASCRCELIETVALGIVNERDFATFSQ
jgi:hypothetical protein